MTFKRIPVLAIFILSLTFELYFPSRVQADTKVFSSPDEWKKNVWN